VDGDGDGVTSLFLIRHAMNDSIGKRIVGRVAGVHLNERGREQARRLVDRLAHVPFSAIYSSPLERAVQTATPLSERLGLPVRVREGLTELDFGRWSGASLEELAKLDEWRQFNGYRTARRPPEGESLLEAQLRMVTELELLSSQHPEGVVAVFGHGDPLKAALAHYAGISVELLQRIQIEPASVSVIRLAPWGAELRCLGAVGVLAELVV
jgi:broad specificity phosphatase PhoE